MPPGEAPRLKPPLGLTPPPRGVWGGVNARLWGEAPRKSEMLREERMLEACKGGVGEGVGGTGGKGGGVGAGGGRVDGQLDVDVEGEFDGRVNSGSGVGAMGGRGGGHLATSLRINATMSTQREE